MYRIAVLTNSEAQEAFFTEQVSQFCAECEWFPVIETFRDQEQFFETAQKTPPTNVVIALPGVDGLNAVSYTHLTVICMRLHERERQKQKRERKDKEDAI